MRPVKSKIAACLLVGSLSLGVSTVASAGALGDIASSVESIPNLIKQLGNGIASVGSNITNGFSNLMSQITPSGIEDIFADIQAQVTQFAQVASVAKQNIQTDAATVASHLPLNKQVDTAFNTAQGIGTLIGTQELKAGQDSLSFSKNTLAPDLLALPPAMFSAAQQSTVDAMQDAKIRTNGEEISKLKNGDK